jgi:hypothetical protein
LQSDLGRAVHLAESASRKMSMAFGLVGGVLGIGGGILGLQAFMQKSIELRAKLDDLADTLGDDVRTLDALRRQGEISGVSLDMLGGALAKLGRNLETADEKGNAASAAIRALGLDVNAVTAMKPGEAFLAISRALGRFEDGAGKVAVTMALMGRGSAQLIPLMKDLAEAGDVQGRITREQALDAERLEKSWRALKLAFEDSKETIINAVIPALGNLLKQLQEASRMAGSFWSGLGEFAGQIGGHPWRSAGENIKSMTTALREFEAERDEAAAKGDTQREADMQRMMDSIKRQVEFAKFLQRQEALALPGAGEQDVMTRRLGTKQGLDFKLTDSDTKRQIELDKVRADIALKQAKDLEQQRSAILTQYSSMNLLTIREEYAMRRTIAEEADRAEMVAMNAKIRAQQDALKLATAQGDPNQKIAAEAKLNSLLGEREALQQKSATAAVIRDLQKDASLKVYEDKLTGINAQILEMTGRTEEAARRRIKLELEEMRAKAKGDETAKARLKQYEDLQIAQAAFNQSRREQDDIVARLAIEEERIQNAQRSGAIGEFQAMSLLGAKRREAVDQLKAIVEQLEKIAEDSKNPALVLQAEQAKAAMESLGTQVDLVGQRLASTFTNSWADAFTDVIMGTQKAGEAFRNFAKTVIRELVNIAAKEAATKTFGAAGISGFFQKLFSGGSSGGGGETGASEDFGLTGAQYGAFATAGQPFIVGEAGPELFVPASSGEIVPNSKFGGATYNTTINATDAQSFAAMMSTAQGQRVILSAVRRAHHRSGKNAGF